MRGVMPMCRFRSQSPQSCCFWLDLHQAAGCVGHDYNFVPNGTMHVEGSHASRTALQ